MIPSALASASTALVAVYVETLDRTTMTHGTDGGKVPLTGFSNSGILFGSLANAGFRASSILRVSTGAAGLTVSLSGNRAQSYFDRIECVLGTFNQSAATWSYNSSLDLTNWVWSSSAFASTGTSTVDLIY